MGIKQYAKALVRRLGLVDLPPAPVGPQSMAAIFEPWDWKRVDRIGTVDKAVQLLLSLKFVELARHGDPLPSFDDVAFRAFSQNGEDGILHFLFSLIKTTNKKCVEVCAGNGIECNTANLIINHGWTGLLVDGNAAKVREGQKFYASLPETSPWPPQFVHAWITAETINDVIRKANCEGEIDLFSLDIDGNDYWAWKALDCIQPRVVILEYQKAWRESMTMRYDPNYVWPGLRKPKRMAGASLPAFVKLGREKGYRLVCSHACLNAVFLRNDVGVELFPEISADEVLEDPKAKWAVDARKQWEKEGLLEHDWIPV